MDLESIIQIHSTFQKSIHELDSDLNFWDHFVTKWAIPEYQKQNIAQVIHSSAYSAHDIDADTGAGYLKLHEKIREIHSDDLMTHSAVLFSWVTSLSVVRVYNALEILLLQTINTAFFKSELIPLTRKSDVNKLNSKIIERLNGEADKTNNKHLIQFLCENSAEFNSWLKLNVQTDMSVNWGDFFYLISVLRHIVVHQAMLVNKDLLNEIKSKKCDNLFYRYFKLIDLENGSFEVQPIQSAFSGFLNMSIQFAVNSLKFITKQPDFKFLSMR